MKYPKKIKKNNIIGVIAPSAGFTEDKFTVMCKNSKKKLENLGYKVKYSDSCFNDYYGRSNTAVKRAEEFMKFYLDDEIDIIISLSGGEYEMEMIDYLDFDKIKEHKEKLFCGCSDNTMLTFLLTTYCDIASVYGHNFYEIGINHSVMDNYISFLEGNKNKLVEIKEVEEKDESWKLVTPQLNYNCNYINDWKIYSKNNIVEINEMGMLIGGLLDNLICICGTKYDKVNDFLEKYKETGFIWYLDICTLNQEEIKRGLWQLRNADWFKYTKLIIIGRPINQSDSYGKDYRENMFDELKKLDIPIIFDSNIGHIAPAYHMYNGAIVKVSKTKELGTIEFVEE